MLIKLDEALPGTNKSGRVQVAKVGSFIHDVYGPFTISYQDLAEMKEKLESNARRQMIDGVPVLPFDYKHDEENVAAGWITSLKIEKDVNQVNALFAEVDWTPKGAEKIRNKEFAFVSPSIRRNYKDSETEEVHNVILKGATLTNIPFLRDMEAIHLLSENRQNAFMSLKLSGDPDETKLQGVKMQTVEEIIAALPTMSPEDKKVLYEALAAEFSDQMMADNKGLEGEKEALVKEKQELSEKLKLAEDKSSENLTLSEKNTKELSDRVTSLTKTLAEMGKKSEFDQMLSEGKVCEAQRDAFLKNDFAAFAEKQEPLKLTESGSNAQDGDSDVQDKVLNLAEKAMAKAKENGDELTFGDATKQILSENKELATAYNNL